MSVFTEFTGLLETEVEKQYLKMKQDAETGGYHLNPDIEFTKHLIRGLMKNRQRYGYESCPCRLASGNRVEDLDIICPCDYRDQDLAQCKACYCSLYVNENILTGEHLLMPVPERRPSRIQRGKTNIVNIFSPVSASTTQIPAFRCKVCGYLCSRDEPPELCPICKAKKDRFEQLFILVKS
ncbi:ferredoxin-thioredoxin reductase catalytic domain-containing protein [Methanoregula sp.]|jgi:ferredoxin-thioredoxin reductase catalytic chain|uniref:ferredoxin-thioredoxin reductase catalytic domain-containing protein n=1 Tax=Methanoregula sp. TaxID=2052170 RepID=UPI003C2656D0